MRYVEIELTQGNINNDHLYLSSVTDFFPKDSFGGSNSDDVAPVMLEIHCGIGEPVLTDIAGDKNIFRKRSWVKEFFKTHNMAAGQTIIIEHTGDYRFHIYPKRT